MTYLANFTPSFRLAVCLWPLASFVLTLPILAFLYHRDDRLRPTTVLWAYLTVMYVLSLACFTLYPLPSGTSGPGITYGIKPQLNLLGFVEDVKGGGMPAVYQILANVVFFLPLGFAVGRGLGWGLPQTLVLGLLCSLLIESSQLTGCFGLYPYAYRTFDVDDLVWNTSGAVVGRVLAAVFNLIDPPKRADAHEPTRAAGLLRRAVAWAIDLILIECVYLTAVLGVQLATRMTNVWLDWYDNLCLGIWVTVFVLAELVWPALHKGSTPGGEFVHMTSERDERHGWRRALYLVVRCAVLMAAIKFVPVLLPLLVVFYLVLRAMPYDFLPKQRAGKGAEPDVTDVAEAEPAVASEAASALATTDASAVASAPQSLPDSDATDLDGLDEPFGIADRVPDTLTDNRE